MTETTPTPTNEFDEALAEIKATYYDGVELDIDSAIERNKMWFNDGESPDVVPIGRIEVPDELIDMLSKEINFKYNTLEQYPDGDGLGYLFVASKEVDDDIEDVPLSPLANAVLGCIADEFKKIMQTDTQNSSNPDNTSLGSVTVSAGIYQQYQPDVHLDRNTGPLRYVATIVGPGTEFVEETVVDTSPFDTEDGGSETGINLSNPRTAATVLEVNRFIANANPHTEPLCPEPMFRIFVNGFSTILNR